MDTQDKILGSGKFLTLKVRAGDQTQEFLHEHWCDAKVVAVLGFRKINGLYQFALVSERRACWGPERELCSVTGGVDAGEDAETAAMRELEEETGYKAKSMISLGTSRVSKCSDTVCHLFASDLTGLYPGVIEGGGNEVGNYVEWCDEESIDVSPDPLLYVLVSRWKKHMRVDDRKYTITLNEEECNFIKASCDLHYRLMCGEWSSIVGVITRHMITSENFDGRANQDVEFRLNLLSEAIGVKKPESGYFGIYNPVLPESVRLGLDLIHAIDAGITYEKRKESFWIDKENVSCKKHTAIPHISVIMSKIKDTDLVEDLS